MFELRLPCVIFENEIDTKLKILASDEYRELDSAYDIQISVMEEIRNALPNILKYPKGLTFNIGVCGAFWSGATTVYYSLADYLRGLGLPVCLIGERQNAAADMDTAKSFVSGKVNLIEVSEANLIDSLKEIHFLVLVSNADKYIGESYEDIPTSKYIVKVINFAREKDCIPMDNVMYMPFLYSKKDEVRANDYWSQLLEKRLSQIISDVDYISKDR